MRRERAALRLVGRAFVDSRRTPDVEAGSVPPRAAPAIAPALYDATRRLRARILLPSSFVPDGSVVDAACGVCRGRARRLVASSGVAVPFPLRGSGRPEMAASRRPRVLRLAAVRVSLPLRPRRRDRQCCRGRGCGGDRRRRGGRRSIVRMEERVAPRHRRRGCRASHHFLRRRRRRARIFRREGRGARTFRREVRARLPSSSRRRRKRRPGENGAARADWWRRFGGSLAVGEAGWGSSLPAVGVTTAQGGGTAAMEGVVVAAECCLDLARAIFFGVGIGTNYTLPTQFWATN
mmetsp:Transcript_39223/g.83746  ORF Transcript_39223/g.83746 Transcript_39223/m.83746 type:complete len:293 (-) Transcript_39223:65-943(-)